MKLSERVMDDLEIYASRVGMNDSEGLARFHKECTPDRILTMIEHVRGLKRHTIRELESRITELEYELADAESDRDYYEDRCDELEEELKDYR